MYSKKTRKINITVNPYFLDDQSEPDEHHFVWAYQVTIDNQGNEKVQLKNRYWKIIDSNGSEQEVKGEGVVGGRFCHLSLNGSDRKRPHYNATPGET